MSKLPLQDYQSFEDLPLDLFNELNFPVYVLDSSWNYIFVNDFVNANLGSEDEGIEGANMWARFPQIKEDPAFTMLKRNSENGLETNIIMISPLTGQKLNMVGKPMKDGFIFYTTIVPNKEDLLRELRNVLKKKE